MERFMTMFARIPAVQDDDGLMAFFVSAETADFCWEERVGVRWLGRYESLDDYADELDRMAITGAVQDRWFAAEALVNGNGRVADLTFCCWFADAGEANRAFHRLR